MGIFSKKKVYVGLSNTRLIPKGKEPQTFKDSTYSYIMDSSGGNSPYGTLVDYNNEGIEKSIVRNMNRLRRWSNKPDNYNSVGLLDANLNKLSDSNIAAIIKESIENQIPYPVTFYYINNIEIDYGHIVRQILMDRYNYNPTTNSMVYEGNTYYLEDGIIYYDKELLLTDLKGPGFRSGYTPNRNQNSSRDYVLENLNISSEYQFNFFKVKLLGEFTIITTDFITEVEVINTVDNSVISKEETINNTEVINNIPIDIGDNQEYIDTDSYYETTSEIIEEDTVAQTITYTRQKEFIKIEHYRGRLEFDNTFSDYLFSQNIDTSLLTDEEVIELVDSIDEPELAVQIGYEYINNADNKIIVYESLVQSDLSGIDNGNNLISFGTFIPQLYFKKEFDFINENKDSALYKESKRYLKKLNLNFDELSKELKDGVEEQKKVRHIYLRFGIDVDSTDPVDCNYNFHFFEKYFKYCDLNSLYGIGFNFELDKTYTLEGKKLLFEDKQNKFEIGSDIVSYTIRQGSIGTIGTYTSSYVDTPYIDNPRHFRRQITENTYEEYAVINLKDYHKVTNKKWARTKIEDGTVLLLPLDFSLINNISGFKNKEKLFYHSIYVEFLTYLVVKVRFYQTGLFKAIVFAVSVILAPFTGGGSLSLNAIVVAVVVNLAIGIAIDFAIKILLKVLSPELVRILAIAIIAAGLIVGNSQALGKLQGITGKAFTVLAMRADLLVKYGTKLFNAATTQSMKDIQTSYLKEKDKYQERMDRLEEFNLNTPYQSNDIVSYLDEDIRYSNPIVGETMDSMIARSLNTNPGLVTINYVHGYVDFILELPTINETIYNANNKREE